jgi:ParB family chromosome partitioning protein
VAAALSERLDTRVKVAMGRNRGRITVEFAGLDDLQRIVTALAPAPVAEVG